MKPDDAGRERAAAAFRKAVGTRSAEMIAGAADIPDPSTVRDFMAGKSWPWARTLEKLERVSGIESLTAIALGEDVPAESDPVTAAVEGSALTRGNKHRLLGIYYDMLDEQGEVRGA